jgi:superfamily II DNA or RNA helicase
MKLTPRPYQLAARDAALADFDRGLRSTLIVLPTGTGKTVVFALVGDSREWGRVLILAPRQELVYQAVQKVQEVTGDRPDIEMGDQYAPTLANDLFASSKYVVGTIQTVSKKRRLDRFNWRDFGLVIVDEGHHATAASYIGTIEYIRRENPDVRVLLVTATPDRADGQRLGRVADSVAYRMEIDEAIRDGWLVRVDQAFAHIAGLDFSHLRTRGGDLDEGELSAMLLDDGGEMNHKIAAGMVQAAGKEKCMIFTVNVKAAESTAKIINRMEGVGRAVAVDGTWDDDRRKAVLDAYRRNEFQFLVNCQLFLEGYDDPSIAVIGMARPTKSRALYAQAVGRGLRPLPGVVDAPGMDAAGRVAGIASSAKSRCLVVDLAGNSGRHKLVCTADLLGSGYDPAVVEAARKRAARRKTPADMKELLEDERRRLADRAEEAARKREAVKRRLYGTVDMTLVPVDPFGRDAAPAPRDEEFRRQPRTASDGQVQFLERMGIPAIGLSFDQAQALIRQAKHRQKLGLATLPQKRQLERLGVPGAEHMGKARASAVLDLAKANGWRAPPIPNKAELGIRPVAAGDYRIVWRRPDGKKVFVGKPLPSENAAREYGKLLIGG